MDNTINGRTPDEIKKGLECCCGMHDHSYCRECPYSENDCDEMSRDALAYIQQIERERDAAVECLSGVCDYCKHGCKMNDFCVECCTHDYCNWEWRGVQKEVE